jgi:hypothetical protein
VTSLCRRLVMRTCATGLVLLIFPRSWCRARTDRLRDRKIAELGSGESVSDLRKPLNRPAQATVGPRAAEPVRGRPRRA